MKKVALSSIAIATIIAGTVLPSNTVSAKKRSIKHQSITSVTFNNFRLAGKAKAGSKISVYHVKQKLGSASIKKSHFTFKWSKLKHVKNNWKLKLVATKKGYKKTSKTIVAHVYYPTATPQKKAKSEYFSDNTLHLKQGIIKFGISARESDGMDGTNILVFIDYTNTTSKPVDLNDLINNSVTAQQSIGAVTKDLDIGVVDTDSQFYDQAQVIDDVEEVNPGRTVSTIATWELDDVSAPVKLTLTSPDDYDTLGTLTY